MCVLKNTLRQKTSLCHVMQHTFPLSPHRSYLMGQLDILRMSPPPISCEECFVVKVNLVGRKEKKKSLLWDLCLSRYKGKRTLMIHFNNVCIYLFFPP